MFCAPALPRPALSAARSTSLRSKYHTKKHPRPATTSCGPQHQGVRGGSKYEFRRRRAGRRGNTAATPGPTPPPPPPRTLHRPHPTPQPPSPPRQWRRSRRRRGRRARPRPGGARGPPAAVARPGGSHAGSAPRCLSDAERGAGGDGCAMEGAPGGRGRRVTGQAAGGCEKGPDTSEPCVSGRHGGARAGRRGCGGR